MTRQEMLNKILELDAQGSEILAERDRFGRKYAREYAPFPPGELVLIRERDSGKISFRGMITFCTFEIRGGFSYRIRVLNKDLTPSNRRTAYEKIDDNSNWFTIEILKQ